jgi:hypothetical protein
VRRRKKEQVMMEQRKKVEGGKLEDGWMEGWR